MGLTREEITTVVAHTLNQLEHDYDIEGVQSLGRPTLQEIAERIYVTENPTPNPRYTWTGWFDGEEDVSPPEPGKEWLTIFDHGEELAIIVLRTDAETLQEGDKLIEARDHRQDIADRIVNALNAQEAK